MNDDIRSGVRAVVEEILELDPEELTDTGDFFNEYQCTSLRFMGLVLGVERRFGIRYAISETEQLACVDDVVKLTERYMAAKAV